MKFCQRPFDHMHIGETGKARCCSWAKHSLGNLKDASVEELWQGSKAAEIRQSIEDQSFRFCDPVSCPLIQNNLLTETDDFEAEKQKWLRPTPRDFNLAYDFVCNHVCPSCRDSLFRPDENYKQLTTTVEHSIGRHIQHAHRLTASGNGDIFSSEHMLNLISKFKPTNPDCNIYIETNGSLVKKRWHHVAHLEAYKLSVMVTPNSYEEKNYAWLAGHNNSYQSTMESLFFLKKLRAEQRIAGFRITMVVQEKNYREIPNFIKTSLESFNPDLVQLRMIKPWFKLDNNSDFKHQDLTLPSHPEHQGLLETLKDPICQHPKVFFWDKQMDPSGSSSGGRNAYYLSTVIPNGVIP